ncbi:hypothetical protein [Clostridium oryzae]|uniref:Carbohydrate kinase PfkB domain-containing protein n=1 Tax=Clostridium oryzae TaxID=1450648 RepID=A0A1V4I5I1_9CLOT|nr:hypothetical protein [Clostridium oryzae]OPJ55226.1 hypothetical protein CLORY_44430 [Clostridium oryzae]
MNTVLSTTIEKLKSNMNDVNNKTVTLGLDAFIDKIVRIVRSKDNNCNYVFFDKMHQFGSHLIDKSGKSCCMEMSSRFIKLGGNSPIMASALSSVGVHVNCMSALGLPDINPIFEVLRDSCSLYSIGNPGETMALEFNDGKVILSERDSLNKLNWDNIKMTLGVETIKKLFFESNLIALVNWTGIINYNSIYRGILNDILCTLPPDKSKIFFVDLADISDRSNGEILEALSLLKEFNSYYKVVLGLNENETTLVYKNLFSDKAIIKLKDMGDTIYNELNLDSIVIHTLTSSLSWDLNSFAEIPSLYTRNPKLSTGGGDNFNSGLCFGLLMGLGIEGSLYTANATSGYYVRNAKSPNINNLIDTLENWSTLNEI